MKTKTFFCKAVSTLLMALLFWTFQVFLPHEEIKQLDIEIGSHVAYAGDIYRGPEYPTPPLPVDLSDPGILKYSWARVSGNESAVYLNIPSNQLSRTTYLPSPPSPMILAKYDPESRVGTLALMRMTRTLGHIGAEIVQLTPKNFHHSMGKSFRNFAWLDFNYNQAGCDINQKMLGTANPPQIIGATNGEIINDFRQYDWDNSHILTPWIFTPTEQAAINANSYYWYQRLNNDPCFTHVAFKDYDGGDGDWHNISLAGFYKLVAFAHQIHKAGVSFIALPNIRQAKSTRTQKSFFRMKQTTTVSYYLSPKWIVGTRANRGSYSDFVANPTWIPSNDVSFVTVQGNHSFPDAEYLIYQWSQTQSGFTGLFVFIAIVAIAMVAGALIGAAAPALAGGGAAAGGGAGAAATAAGGIGSSAIGALIGTGAGSVGGLLASGFSPSLSTTADITPFIDSSYDFSHPNLSGQMASVEQNTFYQWLNAPMDNTPGGFTTFITGIDLRKALACGGASHTSACSTPAITQIGRDDPRFEQIFKEMFNQPTKDLQQYKYPFTQR